MKPLDQLLDEAHQWMQWAKQADAWDNDTYETANENALDCFCQIDERLRAGEPYPALWQAGR